jgi:WD40 repeat protein
VAVSPDGKLLVAATLEQIPEMVAKVHAWDAATGKELGVFGQHKFILFPGPSGTLGGVTAVAFSRDGRWLAYGVGDGVIKRWRRDPGAARWPIFRELPPLRGHQGLVNSLSFSPDGKLLASAGGHDDRGNEGLVRFAELLLWDVETGKQLHSLSEKQGEFSCAVFSPDGKTLAASNGLFDPEDAGRPPAAYPTLRLWAMSPAGPRLRTVLATSTEGYGALAFAPDGKTLASAASGSVQLWNLGSGKVTHLPVAHPSEISFSPDGKSLATADGRAVELWDVLSGKAAAAFREPGGYPFLPDSVVFGPDGRALIAGSRLRSGYHPGKVKIIDLTEDSAPRTLAGDAKPIGLLVFSPDGGTLASATGARVGQPPEKTEVIRLWDAVLGKARGPGVTSGISPTTLAFSTAGRLLTSAGVVRDEQGGRSLVQQLDVTTGRVQEEVVADEGDALRVTLSPAGDKAATVSSVGIHLFDIAASKPGPTIPQKAYLAAFSPDGTMLAAAFVENPAGLHSTGIVKFWEVATGRELASWTYQPPRSGHPNLARGITAIHFSADGRSLLVNGASMEMSRLEGNQDTSCVKRWDVVARREVVAFRLRGFPLALSPDGRTLAGTPPSQVLYNPTEVKLWDAWTGQERATLRGHQSPVRAARFSPDGLTLVTGDEGGVIKVWSAAPYLERDAVMAATAEEGGAPAVRQE